MSSQSLLASLVSGIRVETAWGPEFTVAPFASSTPSPIARALRPKFTVLLAGGGEYAIAPYGEPGPTKWPLIQAGLIFAGIVIAGMLISSRIRRKS